MVHNNSFRQPISDFGLMHLGFEDRTPPARLLARAFFSALFALAGLACGGGSAAAWPFWDPPQRHRHNHQRPHHHHRQRQLEQRERAEKIEVKKPVGPMFAIVSLASQRVTFYDANGVWERSGVSTGVPGHPTPTGIFAILEKERWHRSNIYSGAPMPFMQRLAWTGVAMHEGAVHEGHTASHGCIRLHADFARRLFAATDIGQRVIVSQQDIEPVDIANPRLPQPRMQVLTTGAAAAMKARSGAVEPVALGSQADMAGGSPPAKQMNPGEFARAMKAAAAARAKGAQQSKKAALSLLEVKSGEARLATRALDQAEAGLRRAQGELDVAARNAAKAQGDEALAQKLTEKKAAAEGNLAAAEASLRDARDAKEAKDREMLAARNAIQAADAAAEEAAAESKQAARRLEPLSMFISRKTNRLYVRQATVHLFDVPVVVRDPQRAIGTHLFIATKAEEDGASLHWVAITPPAAVEVKVRPHSSRRGRKIHPEVETEPHPSFPETPSAALDRIEIPEEAAQRISELVWTGATLIISDVGMSGEGRFAMDFQILGQTKIREYD